MDRDEHVPLDWLNRTRPTIRCFLEGSGRDGIYKVSGQLVYSCAILDIA